MEQEEFIDLCQKLKSAKDYTLSQEVLSAVKEYHTDNKKKLPVVWLETNDSGDNNISFMNTTYPYLGQVFEDLIDLLYSNTFMAAQGPEAFEALQRAARELAGEFVLVIEGAVPIKDDGLYSVVVTTDEERITALEAVNWLGRLAREVVAIGTCASFGGASAAKPNISGSVPVSEVLDRQIINVSGCPVNPDWFVGTLAHLLMYGRPELDNLGRPLLFYGFTVHRHCQRRSYFDAGQFAEKLGDIECMFSQGCVGPRTGADCPYRQWVNQVSWPVEANTPCIGCTTQEFPDGSSPFFVPLPEKNNRERERREEDTADQRGEIDYD